MTSVKLGDARNNRIMVLFPRKKNEGEIDLFHIVSAHAQNDSRSKRDEKNSESSLDGAGTT